MTFNDIGSSSDNVVSMIRSMRQRERQYVFQDYLYSSESESSSSEEQQHSHSHHHQTSCCDGTTTISTPLDEECRTRMSLWCSQIIEHCNFSQQTCVIAMNSLDRFLSVTPWARQDRSAFQLASITCLYTAIKIHETSAIAIESMAELTKGAYTVKQIETMERIILQANQWLVHPPTSYEYSKLFCEIASAFVISDLHHGYECNNNNSSSSSSSSDDTLWELTKLQLDTSMHSYDISLSRPSEVAFAAVRNAAEAAANLSSSSSAGMILQDIEDLLSSIAMIDPSSPSVIEIERILYESVALGGGGNDPTMSTSSCIGSDKFNSKRYHIVERFYPSSPRSVSAVKPHIV